MSSRNENPARAARGSESWAIVVAVVVLTLGGAELFFRSNVLWRLPLEYLLQHETDRYTRAAWLIHRPPAQDGVEIMVIGSSTAAAVVEPPDSQEIFRTALARPTLQLTSLTDSGGCYPEHLTLLESALEHGHRPAAVILFSFPTCLGPYDDTDALLARRMPLVSALLDQLERNERSLDVRIKAELVRISAVERYRYTVNAWLRERWKDLLLGRVPWRAIAFEGDRRLTSWGGSWQLDERRYERLKNWSPTGPAARQLATILDLARQKRIPTLVVESPWSPPFFEALGHEADRYFQAMRSIAAGEGASYVDPNRSERLSPELFNDLVHVNHTGARAYMPLVAAELRKLAHAW